MCWLHSTLSNGMWDQEEIKCSVNNLRLLNETIVNISTLGRISNHSISMSTFLTTTHLEESLADSLVDNDQGNLGHLNFGLIILFLFFLVTSK